jgi:hypothetical protein
MEITWQPDEALPADPIECGHGCGVCRETPRGRLLVAFADGFEWYHGGDRATVRYASARLPAETAAAAGLRSAFEALLAARDFDRPLPAGYSVTVNG